MSKTNSSSKKTVARSTEAPAKRVRRASDPAPATVVDISDDQVAALAYRYFVEGGYQHGHAMEHWLRAESELRGH